MPAAKQGRADLQPFETGTHQKGLIIDERRAGKHSGYAASCRGHLEVDRLKAVTRKVRPVGLDRFENSAEHSWQIALFAASLVPYADGPIDLDRTIRMLLVHVLGEIETGDTIVFAREGWQERKSAEWVAVERMFGILPKSTGEAFLALWEEFELAETGEARFAHAVDRAMPVLLNLSNGGGSWKEHGISHARVMERVGPEIEAGALRCGISCRTIARISRQMTVVLMVYLRLMVFTAPSWSRTSSSVSSSTENSPLCIA